MLFKLKYLILALIISVLSYVAPVYGATYQDVTVVATPKVSGGISSFVITYVSEFQLDFDWTLTGTADRIMIRASYNDYPEDIPDTFTTPSDGYLIYYGDGLGVTHCEDTSVNFDENMGTLYVKAWAQKNDDTWFVTTFTGSEESEIVTLILLFGFGVIMSYIAIRTREQITALAMAFVASAIWLACIIYTRANPIGSMTTGDGADNAILTVLLALMVLVPVVTWRVKSNERKKEAKEDSYKESTLPRKKQSLRGNSTTRATGRETPEEYEQRILDLTNPRRR